jgi:hypothetical protein
VALIQPVKCTSAYQFSRTDGCVEDASRILGLGGFRRPSDSKTVVQNLRDIGGDEFPRKQPSSVQDRLYGAGSRLDSGPRPRRSRESNFLLD